MPLDDPRLLQDAPRQTDTVLLAAVLGKGDWPHTVSLHLDYVFPAFGAAPTVLFQELTSLSLVYGFRYICHEASQGYMTSEASGRICAATAHTSTSASNEARRLQPSGLCAV